VTAHKTVQLVIGRSIRDDEVLRSLRVGQVRLWMSPTGRVRAIDVPPRFELRAK
jgi:hypothetical protein